MKAQTRELLTRRLDLLRVELDEVNRQLRLTPQHRIGGQQHSERITKQVLLEGHIRRIQQDLYNNPQCEDEPYPGTI